MYVVYLGYMKFAIKANHNRIFPHTTTQIKYNLQIVQTSADHFIIFMAGHGNIWGHFDP